MRMSVLLGAVLLVVGGFIVARGVQYTSRKDVIDLGAVKVSADEKKTIPVWIGGAVACAGLVLIFAGASKRRG
jgi:hypothetical protein